MTAADVARALRDGAATLDSLAARAGAGTTREERLWGLQAAIDRGWVVASGDTCEGLCGSTIPTYYRGTRGLSP